MSLRAPLPSLQAAFAWRRGLVTAMLAGKRRRTVWNPACEPRGLCVPKPELEVLKTSVAAGLRWLEACSYQSWLGRIWPDGLCLPASSRLMDTVARGCQSQSGCR